jgi:hypothetical protein
LKDLPHDPQSPEGITGVNTYLFPKLATYPSSDVQPLMEPATVKYNIWRIVSVFLCYMHILSTDKQQLRPGHLILSIQSVLITMMLRISADNPDDLTALMSIIEARPDVPRYQQVAV